MHENALPEVAVAVVGKQSLAKRYREVRKLSEWLIEPLSAEDCTVQSMPDVSPTRWHLAHTTWFFETFVLKQADPGYQPFDPDYEYLFNSYYNTVGEQYPRARRGLITRPSLSETLEYRRHVDDRVLQLLQDDDLAVTKLLPVVEIGLHHEQQHQELLLTDIKHVLSCNPLFPVYRERAAETPSAQSELQWLGFAEGVREIGHCGEAFAYDNETPRHRTYVHAFELASRLATCGEYLAFIQAGGYDQPQWWLSEGWAAVQAEGWQAPLYWLQQDGGWQQFTLAGLRPLDLHEPVTHLSYFEADAFARWSGARLPNEAEWEVAAMLNGYDLPATLAAGNFVETERFHPRPAAATGEEGLQQMFGDAWEWTSSSYAAYPGYRPPPGALGEYNGKFMCNQYVLRGGSCATSRTHMRPTYRNFFPTSARWQFSGVRLARDLK